MKSFIIFDKETLERQHSYEANEKVIFGGKWGHDLHLEVPEGFDHETAIVEAFEDSEIVVIKEAETIPAVTEIRNVYNEDGELVLDEDGNPVTEVIVLEEEQHIPEETETRHFTNYRFLEDETLAAQKQLRLKQEQVSLAYEAMDKDVFDACEVVYGTRRSDSATAFYLTWIDMRDNPSAYVGAMFPSAEAVMAYITPKLQAAQEYAVFRLSRIAQFEAERAAILGGN